METETNINPQEIMDKLARIQVSIDYIKNHIVDTTLTEEDIEFIEIAEKEFEEGKTIFFYI